MDGHYQNKRKKHIKKISSWINYMIQTKGWERIDDIHINEIDSFFENKEFMLDGSLYLYDIAYNLIDKTKYVCMLCISLKYGRKMTNMHNTNITIGYIKKRLSNIYNPSIYLFEKNDIEIISTLSQSYYLKKLSNKLGKNVYFLERNDGINEFGRNIFICGSCFKLGHKKIKD